MNAMIAAGQEPQALRRLVEQLRLRQDAAADGDHGVSGEYEVSRHGNGVRFGACHSPGIKAGDFRTRGRFVDVRCDYRAGGDANLGQQRETPQAGGRQHKSG